jgi:hypothetical protein
MRDPFLEEQLARIMRLTERMTQVAARQAELSNELARERESIQQSPLSVRDYRVYRPEDAEPPRRATADETPRRRRRR